MITIIAAMPSDLDAVVASAAALFREDAGERDPLVDTGWPDRAGAGYYGQLIDDSKSLVLVARADQTVIGHLVGKLSGPQPTRPVVVAVLESVHVDAGVRDVGVGTRLVEEFLSWARAHDAVQAIVSAYAANEAAQRLYARHGFTPESVEMHRTL